MRIQIVGLGNVGLSLLDLMAEKERDLASLGIKIDVISVSDSLGTATDISGLNVKEVIKCKRRKWSGFCKYTRENDTLSVIRTVDSDVLVELTQSTPSGEPGLSHIRSAIAVGKHVVTANKGPLVVAYRDLMEMSKDNNVRLLYEATVAAHVPVFCLVKSCLRADQIEGIRGILNATTNFILGEMEGGKSYQQALEIAVKSGWTETECSDDIDGTDAARKVVILADALFSADAQMKDVKVEGIRNVTPIVKSALAQNSRAKLICEIVKTDKGIDMSVAPRIISVNDPMATVNGGDMGLEYRFKTSKRVFVSAEYLGPKQTAYAVLNDLLGLERDRKFT